MSKAQKPARTTTIPEDEDLTPQPMSRRRRLFLIGVAIFCLLIFSVTGPMMTSIEKMFGGGPPVVATAELPSGKIKLTDAELQRAHNLIEWEARLMQGMGRDKSEEAQLVYAVMRELADDIGLVVPDERLRFTLARLVGPSGNYLQVVRNLGFTSPLQFENLMRDVLRVPMLEDLMMSAVLVPNDDEVLASFKERFEEFQAQYVVWEVADFATAALALEPTEEELQTFYDEGLSFTQRRELENEEAVAFDALLVSAEALETEAVQAWAPSQEPTEEELDLFYEFNRRFLYERPLPEDGSEQDPELGPYLSREELGDRVARDWLLQRVATALQGDAAESEDLAALATEKGVELIQHAEPVPASQLVELPRVGGARLNQLLRVEEGVFLANPVLGDGYALIARATAQVPRELPALEEIRDSVIDYWRESKQPELATEAAEAFVAAFPQPEVEGDAIVVDAEVFSQAATDGGLTAQTLGWLSRNRRPSTDPVWAADDEVSDWLRSRINGALDDAVEGQILGPYENTFVTDKYIVVARLVGTREPSTDSIWPSELTAARQNLFISARASFRADQLSYEAFARHYSLSRVGVDL